MILHLDLDCYFVSAERTRAPQLCDRPVVVVKSGDRTIFSPDDHKSEIVGEVGAFNALFQHAKQWRGYDPDGWKKAFVDDEGRVHGLCIAKSYEAKHYGIATGTSLAQALILCPDLCVIEGDHLFYQLLSKQLRAYLQTKIPVLEQYSIDEFWGDVSGWVADDACEDFAKELQRDVLARFGLPMSIGISSAKWIAKLATDVCKPFGVCMVPQERIVSFVQPIAVEDFPGIGRALTKRLHQYGITTLGEVIMARSLLWSWGRIGRDVYARIVGEDHEAVIPYHDRRSIGIARNFAIIHERDEVTRRVIILARHLAHTIFSIGVMPTTFFLKVRYEGGMKVKGTQTCDRPCSEVLLREVMIDLWARIDTLPRYGVCHIAMSASNFHTPAKRKTFSLWDYQTDTKYCALSTHVTRLRQKYGVDIVRSGAEKRGEA